MSRADRLAKLKSMLAQVSKSAGTDQESALESTHERVASMEGVPTEAQEVALDGLKKLSQTEDIRDDTIDDRAQYYLEAIILPRERPAVLIVQDSFSQPPSPWQNLNPDSLKTAIRSIGRIEVPNHPSVPYGGTGFVVGPNLIMTNRHVAGIFTSGIGRHQLQFLPGRTSAIDFQREIVPTPPRPLNVTEVVMVHPFWDMALLRVEGLTDGRVQLPLSVLRPEELDNRQVVVIGYPARDWRSDVQLQNEIFGGMFEVKRLQPGHIRGVRSVESFGNQVDALTHDASTLGGNSGSAVVDVETGHVVALHFAGVYLDANFCVPMHELARDRRVVDCGLNFQGNVASSDPWAAVWRMADPVNESVAAAAPSATTSTASVSTANAGSNATSMTTGTVVKNKNSFEVTIPIKISVSLGIDGLDVDAGAGAAAAAPVSGHALVSTKAGPTVAESTAMESVTDADVAKAYARFSSESLAAADFQWTTAISTGVASHLAYETSTVILETVRNRFKFDVCEFVENDDTQCFVAANGQTILLSMRGTAQIADFITDIRVFTKQASYGTVHRGFYFGFQAVKADLQEIIRDLRTSNQRLVITGHSLGGALAVVAAAEWQSTFPDILIHTFGQPRVGRNDYLKFMDDHFGNKYYRYVNDDDVVTRIPPWHGHTGILKHFGPTGQLLQESLAPSPASFEILRPAVPLVDSTEAPPLTNAQFIALQESLKFATETNTESIGLEGFLPSLSDHRMNGYLKKILQQT